MHTSFIKSGSPVGKRIPFQGIAVALILLANSLSLAQNWTPVATPNFGQFVQKTPYFLDPKTGFLYADQLLFPFFRTTDAGTTWENIGNLGAIKQIGFVSISHGFLNTSAGELYQTFDTGSSWNMIAQSVSSFYAAGSAIFALSGNTVSLSTDSGKLWIRSLQNVSFSNLGPDIFGNNDSLVFVTGGDAKGVLRLWYSEDMGSTWQSNIMNPAWTHGIFCLPHCNRIFRTYLPNLVDYYPIILSTDFGNSWKTTLPSPEIGAWITGNSCAMYVSNASDASTAVKGVYRSTDQGNTWNIIPGPDFTELDDGDFHNLSVVGYGAVVYATDIHGTLWKTTNGGDNSMLPSMKAPVFSINDYSSQFRGDTLYSTICDTSSVMFTLENTSCSVMSLESFQIIGLDPDEYSVVFKRHLHCDNLADTFLLSIRPHVAGIRVVAIRRHFADDEFQGFDSSLRFNLNVSGQTNASLNLQSTNLDSINRSIDFGNKPLCFGGERDTIALSNRSCDAIRIIDASLETDSVSKNDFSISGRTPLDLNVKNSPLNISVLFHPELPGQKSGKLIIRTAIGNDTILLSGSAFSDTAKLIVTRNEPLIFESRPLCIAGGKDTIQLSNPSCYNVNIRDIRLEADSMTKFEFAILSSGPAILRADAAPKKIFVTFHPFTVGTKSGNLIIETDLRNDTIPVYAKVGEDIRQISSRCDSLHSSICDSVEGYLHIHNLSCREMSVESVSLPHPFQLLSQRYPIVLNPGDSAAIHVQFTPEHRGIAVATATATISMDQPGNAERFDTSLILSAFATQGSSSFSLSSASLSFDSLHLCESAIQRVVLYSTGCDSLPLRVISISGDTDFSYSVAGSMPKAIASGDSWDPLESTCRHASLSIL